MPRGGCAICGKQCSRGYYETDLIYITEAISLGASLKSPVEKVYHQRCLERLKGWIALKRKQNDRPTP